MDKKELDERDAKIISSFKEGRPLKEVGDSFGLTNQRVHQILSKHEVSPEDGGVKKRTEKKRIEKLKARDRRYTKLYGCTFDEYQEIITHLDSKGVNPCIRFNYQKQSAKRRGIEWKFNLYQWWQVWFYSGKWNKRGNRIGEYVMARKDDKGPYSVDNVEIITCSANISDGYAYMKKEKIFI